MPLALTEKEKFVLNKFRKATEKAIGDDLVEIKMFGSKARGDARKDSDIDILVITRSDDWHISDVIYGIATDIFLEDEIYLSSKVINNKKYNHLFKMKNPFIKNVIREGINI